MLVSKVYHSSKPPVVYQGKDTVDKFLVCLEKEQYIQETRIEWM